MIDRLIRALAREKDLNNNNLQTSSATVVAHAGRCPEDHGGFAPAIYCGLTFAFPSVKCMQNGIRRDQTEAQCETILLLERASTTAEKKWRVQTTYDDPHLGTGISNPFWSNST